MNGASNASAFTRYGAEARRSPSRMPQGAATAAMMRVEDATFVVGE